MKPWLPMMQWVLALLWLCWPPAPAWAADADAVLRLDAAAARQGRLDAWPALRVLPAAEQAWTIDDVLARDRAAAAVDSPPAVSVDDSPQAAAAAGAFFKPDVPRANFGVRRDAVWLRLELRPDSTARTWMLQIDYPPLNEVMAYRVAGGRVIEQQRLGNAQPFDARPVRSRSHALRLDLHPDRAETLYLRVQTTSSMLVPIAVMTPDAFLADESAMQMLHGLLAGLAMALLVYALVHWVSLRDAMFLWYATILVGVSVFFVSYFGLGQQYLWNSHDGILAKIAPLSVLVALMGGAFFVRHALATRESSPRLHRLQGLVATCAGAVLVTSVAGLLDYRQTQLAATILGPLPMLLGLSEGIRRMRQGDAVARMITLGWLAYTIGAFAMAGLLRGVVPADFWTQHLFQLATLVEMVLWMRVLGLRIQLIRREAERGAVEKQALLSLAHTDALTGLPNRRGLNLALDQALTQARAGSALAVFLVDLDGFKPVNDRLGHDAGDELLVRVGRRLKQPLRAQDVVARLGGDEFVIMAPGVASEADARRMGEKLLRAFDEPFALARGHSCRVGLTIGLALAPQDGQDAAALLRRADAAMYAGKQAGRHCLRRSPEPALAEAG